MERLIETGEARKAKMLENLSEALKTAELFCGGHLTIMFFTTHVKVVQGTPEMEPEAREALFAKKGYPTLAEALENFGGQVA